jgi:hypothetical protein
MLEFLRFQVGSAGTFGFIFGFVFALRFHVGIENQLRNTTIFLQVAPSIHIRLLVLFPNNFVILSLYIIWIGVVVHFRVAVC